MAKIPSTTMPPSSAALSGFGGPAGQSAATREVRVAETITDALSTADAAVPSLADGMADPLWLVLMDEVPGPDSA